MTLWEIFELLRYIVNKDFSGTIITPERFKQLIPVANLDHFRNKYGIPEEYQPGRPIPSESADISLKNTDDLKAFKMSLLSTAVTSGVLPYPERYAHRESFVYNYTTIINGIATVLPRLIEVLRESEFASRNGNYTKRPTIQNPICVLRSNGVYIRPLTILLVDMFYYRFPVDPVFSYILGDGFCTYDAANSVELEWPDDEKLVIMRRCLEYIGVNLRENEIVSYADKKLKEG